MYEYARWNFVDRQKRQKFDNISAGHEAFLIAIGQIKSAARPEETAPPLPAVFAGVWSKYRSLKFMQRDNGESVVLYHRDTISWQDLVAFKAATGETISLLEAELIMGLDAIFEGREDG